MIEYGILWPVDEQVEGNRLLSVCDRMKNGSVNVESAISSLILIKSKNKKKGKFHFKLMAVDK